MRKLLILAIVLVAISAPAFANVLVNGDFATGTLSGWNTWYQRNTGTPVFTVENGQGKFGCANFNGGIWQAFPTVVGVTYTVSGWGKNWTNNGTNQNTWSEVIIGTSAPVQGQDYGSGQLLCAKQTTANTAGNGYFDKTFDQWNATNPVLQFVATQTTTYITLKHGNTTGSTLTGLYADNVAVNAVPEPGSLLVLGTGLVGLAGIIRRKR